MYYVTNGHPGTGRGVKEWKAEVAKTTVPRLTGKTKMVSKTIVDGEETKVVKVLHYIGENGKQYVASLYDKMFGVEKGKVKKHTRGTMLNQF